MQPFLELWLVTVLLIKPLEICGCMMEYSGTMLDKFKVIKEPLDYKEPLDLQALLDLRVLQD
jgi:hypothetical protein